MGLALWAPFAEQVTLRDATSPDTGAALGAAGGAGADGPLIAVGGGWWRTEVEPRGPYRFVVDGTAIPDPRSPHQPHGVDGPSLLVNHDDFAWTDQGWSAPPWGTQVIYELHVGTFTEAGTFAAAIERLDHLVALGVDTVELMPVNTFPGRRGWGYDGVLLYAPHHGYGGPLGCKAFVDAAHARGLAVVLDVVYNHLGPDGNHLGRLGPYFDDAHRTPWGAAVNLEGAGADDVRAFFVDNAVMWVRDYHFDGLRVDAVHAFVDRTARPFLEELTDAVHEAGRAAGRRAWVIAESDLNDPKVVRSAALGGYGFDAAWSDDFHHALHVTLTDERQGYYADFEGVRSLAQALRNGYVYEGGHAPSRGRRHGRPAIGVDPVRLLAYAQTHDQVGNRARGERLAALTTPDRLAVAAALVLLGPFTPMLFQGEEWGASTPFLYFTDHTDPALGAAVRDGRRAEFASFGWGADAVPDPQAEATFTASVLRWAERDDEPHRTLEAWHRRCIAERRRAQGLGRFTRQGVQVDERAGSLVLDMDAVLVAVNLGPHDALVALPPGVTELGFSTDDRAALAGPALALRPDAVAILRRTVSGPAGRGTRLGEARVGQEEASEPRASTREN